MAPAPAGNRSAINRSKHSRGELMDLDRICICAEKAPVHSGTSQAACSRGCNSHHSQSVTNGTQNITTNVRLRVRVPAARARQAVARPPVALLAHRGDVVAAGRADRRVDRANHAHRVHPRTLAVKRLIFGHRATREDIADRGVAVRHERRVDHAAVERAGAGQAARALAAGAAGRFDGLCPQDERK